MYPDPNNPGQPQPPQQPQQPATPPQNAGQAVPQPLPQYPSPYPPSAGQQSWQQPGGAYQQVDTTPQLPEPQLPGRPAAYTAPTTNTSNTVPQMNPLPAQSSAGSSASSKKPVFIAAAVVIALLAVGIAAYFLVKGMQDGGQPAQQPATSNEQPAEDKPTTAAMASLQGITLVPPSDLSRYTANTRNTELTMAYNTEGNGCSLQLGVVDEATLPGKDLADIVDRQVKALQADGVKVDGPTAGDVLTLKNAADSKKSYTLPTLVFTATDTANKQVRSHYSAAVLKDGKRAYVTRTCQVANGTVDAAALKPLDEDAAKATVRVK